VALLAQMPVKAVADLVGEHDTRLWRLLHHHVEQARAKLDLGEVSRVGVDETSARRGQDYVSLFVDLDAPKPRVIFATEDRDHTTVERFAEGLAAHGGDPAGVRDVSADMSPAFEKGVRASLPKAYLTWDRYHLVSHATKAVDQVRRAEATARPELKGTRYVWLKRPEHLTVKQAATLAGLTPASVGLRPRGRTGGGWRSTRSLTSRSSWPRTTWSAGTRARSAPAWTRSSTSPACSASAGRGCCAGTGPGSTTASWKGSTRWCRRPSAAPAGIAASGT
jgi:Transposase/Helix-turn-helix domain of transposase family ISL3